MLFRTKLPKLPNYCITHSLALGLALLASCAVSTWAPRPVSAPSVAIICAPGREVWCEEGNPECGSVQTAVEAIDAVVPGLLVYKGELPRVALVHKLSEAKNTITGVLRADGVPAAYQTLPLAVTKLSADSSSSCLPAVPVVLIWPSAGLNRTDWNQVVLHEMLHSLGAGHAPSNTPYSTVERPAWIGSERRVGLSKSDRNWLRAVYGQ